jgi:rhamnosyltransferase
MAPSVEIALATYNGARHVEAQLDSYLTQTFDDWGLVVRDDGSSDDTVARIREHAGKHGYPLRFAANSGVRTGYPASFYDALDATVAPYVFFSDQDDVWLPSKMERTLEALRDLPEDRPALVHTDLRVVDAELRETNASYLRLRRLHPPRSTTLLGLLCWEYVTGCTIGLNAAARRAYRRPRIRAGHDAWMALTCAALGQVRYLDEATILYRQHGQNVVGAHHVSTGVRFWRRSLSELAATNRAPLARADALLECYAGALPAESESRLRAFAELDRRGLQGLLSLYVQGALPSDPVTRRRVLTGLTKMQIKHRAFALGSALKGLVGAS